VLSQEDGCRGEWQRTRRRYDKSLAYTTLARILSDRNIFFTPRGGRTTAGSNAPGALLVTPLSGGGSSNTRFFRLYLPRRQDGV